MREKESDIESTRTAEHSHPEYELSPKDKTITLRISSRLLAVIQAEAKSRGINYQKLIRNAVEKELRISKPA